MSGESPRPRCPYRAGGEGEDHRVVKEYSVEIGRFMKVGFGHAGRWVLRDGRAVLELDSNASAGSARHAFATDRALKYMAKTVTR